MTNNKQQTPVEWFAKRIQSDKIFNFEKVLEQAKEMDKEQQEKLSASWAKSREQTREIAMHIGFAKGFMSGIECYEDYYEELIGTQLEEDEFTKNYIADRFEETKGR